MWTVKRHQKILSALDLKNEVSTNELVEAFGVSRETIRRDLLLLESIGHINRVHGGAVLVEAPDEVPFQKRKTTQIREKRAIAKAASALVRPGQSLFVDAGTTTSVVAVEIAKISDLLVITNSIEIAAAFHRAEINSTVLLLGGEMVSAVPATYGEMTLTQISRFSVDIAFLGPVAVSGKGGATYYELHEAEVARAMSMQSTRKVFLADHSKLGSVSRVQCCQCSEIDVLITGSTASSGTMEQLETSGIHEILRV